MGVGIENKMKAIPVTFGCCTQAVLGFRQMTCKVVDVKCSTATGAANHQQPDFSCFELCNNPSLLRYYTC